MEYDLSEDTRKHLDNLYNAIGELSIKPVLLLSNPQPHPLGFSKKHRTGSRF
jgi:hypothetical protein